MSRAGEAMRPVADGPWGGLRHVVFSTRDHPRAGYDIPIGRAVTRPAAPVLRDCQQLRATYWKPHPGLETEFISQHKKLIKTSE